MKKQGKNSISRFLAVGEAYTAILWPTPELRLRELFMAQILNTMDLNFCICGAPAWKCLVKEKKKVALCADLLWCADGVELLGISQEDVQVKDLIIVVLAVNPCLLQPLPHVFDLLNLDLDLQHEQYMQQNVRQPSQ